MDTPASGSGSSPLPGLLVLAVLPHFSPPRLREAQGFEVVGLQH